MAVPCEVNINGEEWYLPCDRVDELAVSDNGYLISVGSSSLTLYQDFSLTTSSSYPRISCNFGRACYLSTGNNQSVSYVSVDSFEVVQRPLDSPVHFIGVFISILIVVVVKWLLN